MIKRTFSTFSLFSKAPSFLFSFFFCRLFWFFVSLFYTDKTITSRLAFVSTIITGAGNTRIILL